MYGEKAITKYQVLKTIEINGKFISVVKCSLITGRTHQIRVHLSSNGNPILGDTLYGSKSDLIDRQALHAYRIKFIHPVSNEIIEIKSSIPKDIENIFERKKSSF